ncbi:NFATC2-interacting protein isoform X2 [Myripristis murdjan]|nr:NFATC2-interacting protein isoform X2 [Myripristis murdjan]
MPPPKRRRIIDPAAVPSVSIYSNKVNSCLQMKPTLNILAEKESAGDSEEASLWSVSPPPPAKKSPVSYTLTDSEEDEPEHMEKNEVQEDRGSPSPPPPVGSPVAKVSQRVTRKIHEFNRKLDAVSSLLHSPPQEPRRRRTKRNLPPPPQEKECSDNFDDDDDIIIVTPNTRPQATCADSGESPLTVRTIPLKVRCRADLHKIPVLSSVPLSKVVDELSVKLKVPPSRIMLLRKEMELPTHLTANELGLSIADIIDCVVMAADDKQEAEEDSSSVITVRLQGKEKGSAQEYTLDRDAPLGSVLSQYLSSIPVSSRCKVQFHFDGSKITHSQTPSQLDMEDGDVIEVWT